MKKREITKILIIMFTLIMAVGCAKTTIKDRHELVKEKLPRPGQIWVYSFAATPDEIPGDSALISHYHVDTESQTKDHLVAGRKLGTEIATELVNQIHAMGMPAGFARENTFPKVNDLVIRGYLISFAEGDSTKRVLIGFGDGTSDLQAAVEAFQMTEKGLRKVGYGSADAVGGKSPGADLGVLGLIVTKNPAGLIIGGGKNIYDEMSGESTVEGRARQFGEDIAEVMKERFIDQGWINKNN